MKLKSVIIKYEKLKEFELFLVFVSLPSHRRASLFVMFVEN